MAISSSSSSSSSDSDVQKCSKCLESFKCLQKNYDTEREKYNKAKLEIRGYEITLEEIKINNLNLELEKAVKERDELKDKIAKWEESTKNLDEILKSQLSARDKTGLGYSTQLNELSSNHETDSENSFSVFDGRSSDKDSTLANDRLDEYAIRNKIIESQTSKLNNETSETTGQTNDANTIKPKSASESVVSNLNKDRVIIEDWYSDDEEEVSEVQTVRPETQTVKTRDDKSGQTSKKQGIGFRKVKACFVCKSTDHLIKDCNFHDKKSQESNLKNVVNTGKREGKPVWDNTKRVNHQNLSKYPHLSKIFVPSGVLTRTGFVSTARSSISTARPVCTARPSINTARPVSTASPSQSRDDLVLDHSSRCFKLLDESQVVLRAPRKDDVYNLDIKNIVPFGGITCLYANTTADESKLWHRRLGHVNFKNINKLVKGHLVRGLPSKVFVNDHTCVACKKGKQHKASCKAKLERIIRKPLELLHMDLFGPVFVESINKKRYCLVVTDDFSRFSWVFFLATKDETSEILCNLIIGLEKQLNHNVKIIRCDNGTEFKNYAMNEFCAKKGIKREFSIARTPQQNGVTEKKNRTLIEAARTMLADSLLPIPFWAEAVNTACYVLNRVLVTKPQNKTPYELLIGKSPSISFMRPFGCPLTILNTLDSLGKFDGKSDEDKDSNRDVAPAAIENTLKSSPKDNDIQDPEDVIDKEGQPQMPKDEQVLHDELEKMVTQELTAKAMDDVLRQAFEEEKKENFISKEGNSGYNAARNSTGANAGESSFVYLGGKIPIDASTLPNADLPIDPNIPNLEDASDTLPMMDY
ncbi:putative ribonuclease H-like domain-containing protein [Tanacetum coccineum]